MNTAVKRSKFTTLDKHIVTQAVILLTSKKDQKGAIYTKSQNLQNVFKQKRSVTHVRFLSSDYILQINVYTVYVWFVLISA